MRTKLTELFDIALPIIQAPMAGVQDSALTLAVSNAGALGSLPCAMLSVDALQRELITLRTGTDRPYNLNFFCHTPPIANAERELTWRQILAPYYTEMGLDPAMPSIDSPRAPFTAAVAELLHQFAPPIVSFHFGLPAPLLLDHVRNWGGKIIGCATTVAEARWLDAHGVDAIIAQGIEAGGHRGMFLTDDVSTQIGTFALLPQIVAAVRAPVIAAGGIADARGVQAALALGAAAVQIGTSYMLCTEATTRGLHRAALLSEAAQHTALTNLFSGRPARGIVNRLMRDLAPINSAVPEFPLAAAALAPLRARAEQHHSGDFSPLWCGQNASGCRAISAGELTRSLMEFV